MCDGNVTLGGNLGGNLGGDLGGDLGGIALKFGKKNRVTP